MLWPINQPLTNATSAQSPRTSAPPCRADDRGAEEAELQPISGLLPQLLYERYGILENPFGVTPNPRYLYHSKTHNEARASLIIGIECGIGFQALIAPPGMGKTTILFHLLERFKDVARTALLFQIHGDSHDFLRYLLSELGSDVPSSVDRLQEAINQLLIQEFRSGRRTIVVIDEAQGLNTSVLETIRLLSNFETRSEKLLQIVLAGQPQLAKRLVSPEMSQLHQRISIRTTLTPFGLEDTRNYIEHRLEIAGYKGPPLFTSAAVRLIWERSGGVPREINTLCFNALLLARAAEQKQVHSAILHEVVADLDRIWLNACTPPSGMRGVQTTNGLSLRSTAEDPAATSIDQSCNAAVAGTDAEADDASTRPTASDEVDLVELGTIAAEIVSTGLGEKVKQAAGPGTKAEADDASPPQPAFDEVDLVKLRTIAAEILSTGSGEKTEQAVVAGAKTDAEDASTRPTAFDDVDLVQLGKVAPNRDSKSAGGNADQAGGPGAGAESHDRVGRLFLPDRLTFGRHRKTEAMDALQVMLEALAKAEGMPEARPDLRWEVESELTSRARVDFSTGVKPDRKIEIKPESGSGVESTPEVEPGVAAVVPLGSILAEKDAVSDATEQSLWKTVTRLFRWSKQWLATYRAIIYLGTSMLMFLLVLSEWTWLPQSPPEPMFKALLLSLGLTARPTTSVQYDNPDARVWVDLHTGLYYCPGAEPFGKTPRGKLTTQRQARQEHFKTAGKICQ